VGLRNLKPTNPAAFRRVCGLQAIPPALDTNQPTIFFTGAAEDQRPFEPSNEQILGSWAHSRN
jgi:hypothetical protein